jgi:hypothetical protein
VTEPNRFSLAAEVERAGKLIPHAFPNPGVQKSIWDLAKAISAVKYLDRKELVT